MLNSFEEALTWSRSKEQILQYMSGNAGSFKEAIKLMLSNKQPFAWRAAWLIADCMEDNDKRLRREAGKMVQLLPVANESLQREILKILLKLEVEEEIKGQLFNNCEDIWRNIKIQSAARFYAFKMLLSIAEEHAELMEEVRIIVSGEYIEALSPAIRKSVMRRIKEKGG